MTYVFRNNTIERLLDGDYQFSGYDDYGTVPEAEGYLWWYQVPVKMNREQLVAEVESYTQRLLWVAGQIGDKPLLVLTLECIWETNANLSDRRLSQAVEAFNNTAWSLAAERKNIKVVDFGKFLQQYPVCERIDWKYYFISLMIINPRLKGAFGAWLAEQQRALALQRKKCLVLDLDNTLWGGVLGEDGIEGVQLDGDYPGKAFHAWQEGLRELANEGVILAICSKNNEADVEALFAAREMPLKLEDFVSKRINWQDKATNICAIAEELNIGLDSMVFLDDNPTERELIRQQLPMVAVPEFPAQPYGLAELYAQLVREYFSVYALTDEDRKKTEQYWQNASRKQLEAQFTDMTDFLRSLEMKLKIERVTAECVGTPRVAQMTQKTNQFNLTTRRYTEDDIRSMIAHGAEVWTLAVCDRFGDNGITGLMILVPENGWRIDTMLMSCRVLGKGIEEAFFKNVVARYSGALHAEYIPTAKNGQVADFYARMGLSDCGNGQFEVQIKDLELSIKDYYTIE